MRIGTKLNISTIDRLWVNIKMSKQTASNEIIKPNPNQAGVEGYENSHGGEILLCTISSHKPSTGGEKQGVHGPLQLLVWYFYGNLIDRAKHCN